MSNTNPTRTTGPLGLALGLLGFALGLLGFALGLLGFNWVCKSLLIDYDEICRNNEHQSLVIH